jgi:hypothetical protein
VGSDGKPTGFHPLDLWCKQNEIRHKLIPIGEKELQGKVENTHKQDDRSFYAKYNFTDYWTLENYMRSWNERWNELRATKALHWRTPNEAIFNAGVVWVAHLIDFQKRLPKGAAKMVRIDHHGNVLLPVPKTPKQPKLEKLEKIKEKDFLTRYLDWMDGEAKKLKNFMVLPAIYQIFSLVRIGVRRN